MKHVSSRLPLLAVAAAALALATLSAQAATTKRGAPQLTPQQVADRALAAHIPLSTMSPILVETFKQAAKPQSAATLRLAFKCWKQPTCTTGHGNVTIGIADGNDNPWRKFTRMELILQALQYPEVAKIIYTQANGDLARGQANIKSLISQRVDVIVGYFDFGAATFPQMRQAMRAGIPVVPYVGGIIGGKAGREYTTTAQPDVCAVGSEMAAVTARELGGKGNVVYLTGTPGNPQGQAWQACADKGFAKYPGIKVIDRADTNWSEAGAYQAASAAFGRGEVDAYLYDYATASRGIVRAYEQAGKDVPLIVTWTEDNELFHQWELLSPKMPKFKIYYTNNLNWPARLAVTAALEKVRGKMKIPGWSKYPQPFALLKKGRYDPTKPGDFAASTLVPESLIKQMLGK